MSIPAHTTVCSGYIQYFAAEPARSDAHKNRTKTANGATNGFIGEGADMGMGSKTLSLSK